MIRELTGRPARVLIVDDEPHNRQLLEVMLAAEGLLVDNAASGEEALEMVARRPPDLILLDVMMPGMDGYQVAAAIKSGPATSSIPVIMVTALDDRGSRMAGLSAGAEDFLTKPVDRVELSMRVRNLLRLKAYSDYHDRYGQMLEEELSLRTADLRHERDRAQRYLDTARVILLALDVDGRVTLVNRYACATLGWSAEELMGRSWIDTCLPERFRHSARNRFGDLTAGDPALHESPIVTRSGAERLVEWRNTIVRNETGQPVGSLSSGTDVTERRTLEEQFQQAQKMEAVGQLAGGVAHDFNNLLTVILGFCELLLADGDSGGSRQADIEEIQKAGARGAGLTRQLLAFSRKQIIEPRVLDLNEVVGGMRAMLGRLIGEDVAVVVRFQKAPALVTADRGQIEQIVMNLAINARDAMPNGGTLTIETADVELDQVYAETHAAVIPGAYAALTVTDTGIGMSPQVQTRLFEPFFTTKEPGKGTGLGMATVYGIVTRGGGSITVDSAIGKGTTFTVYLPRTVAAELIAETVAAPARRHDGTQTVLVVEDEDGLRELAKRLLERHGYTVLLAANGEAALRIFESHPAIDVLLTDVVMPGASGPELTRKLVAQRPALRVIYMSGHAADAVVQAGVHPGIAFLNKPFTAETLGDKIRDVLEH